MHASAAEPLCTVAPLRMSRGAFLRTLARMKARRPLALLATAVTAAVAAGIFIDVRWSIVALMLVTVVAPMIMAFLYIVWAISPRCLHNVHPHAAKIYPEHLSISYTVTSPPAEEGEEPQTRTVEETIPAREIVSFRVGMNEVTVTMRSPFGFIVLPYDRASDPETLLKWLRELNL